MYFLAHFLLIQHRIMCDKHPGGPEQKSGDGSGKYKAEWYRIKKVVRHSQPYP